MSERYRLTPLAALAVWQVEISNTADVGSGTDATTAVKVKGQRSHVTKTQ